LVRQLQRERRKFACLSNATTSPLRIMMRLKRMGIDLDEVTHIYTAGAAACDYVMQRFTKDQTTGQTPPATRLQPCDRGRGGDARGRWLIGSQRSASRATR
jgi:hypothetical protein